MNLKYFEITIYDNKNEQHNSFTAELHGEIFLNAYGETKEEALYNLESKVMALRYNLKNIDFTDIKEK